MRLVIFILSLSLLQGCAGLLIAGAATGGALVYDHRDIKTIHQDEQISHQINLKIANDPAFNSSHIVVATLDHNVLLTGQTPVASLRVKAEKQAKTVPNIKRLSNEIVISGPTSLMTRTSDTVITTKVKSRLLTTRDLRSGNFKVVTENGDVYLMGKVTRDQADLAVDAARRVGGVQKVIKVFEYTG